MILNCQPSDSASGCYTIIQPFESKAIFHCRRFPLRRKISLLIILAFISTLAAINHGCSRSGADEISDKVESLSFDPNDPKIKDRLGVDDGYAFAVFYGADLHGSLETCG